MSWGDHRIRPVIHHCERRGCSHTFVVPDPAGGKGSNQTRKRYCSAGCYATALKHRKGVRSQVARRFDTCPSGHDRSPENVYEYVIKSGPKAGYTVRRCRPCFNSAQRAYRLKEVA